MSIYNRKHWHALSHSLHFVRHEGRLATIGRTRLTRCGTSSSSYSGMFFRMVISTGPPTCAQDDGGIQAKVLCFSYFCHLVGRVSFLRVYGVVEVLIYELSVRILFASCDSQSIVCPCKLNWGRHYCQFVFKLCEVDAIQNCSTFRVLPRTL